MMRARLGAVVIPVAVVAAVLAGCAGRRPAGRAASPETRVRTAVVKPADFRIVLALSGVLETERMVPMVNTAGETQIASTLADGTWVKAGDVVLKLDATDLEKKTTDLELDVAQAQESVRSAQADGEKRVQNARTGLAKAGEALQLALTRSQADIERAQAEVAFAEREAEVAQGQLDKQNRLANERLVTITEVEKAEDELKAKTFLRDKALRSVANAQEQAERNKRLREIDIQKAELELTQAQGALQTGAENAKRNLRAKQDELERSQQQLSATLVKAPASGMVLLDRRWDEVDRVLRPYMAGDRVWDNRRLGMIIDPTAMRVRCDVAEADIERVKVKQRARVVVPAISGTVFSGEVEAMDNLARERRFWEGGIPGKKVFAALIRLRAQDRRLRPGMSATVAVELARVRTGLAVPAEAVFRLNGRSVVYRERAGKLEPLAVKPGKGNEFEIAVEATARAHGGAPLRVGDRVACEPPPLALRTGAAPVRRLRTEAPR